MVTVEGDSIVTEARGGPLESVFRKGVQVNSRRAPVLQGDTLTGATIARYDVKGPEMVATL